MLEPMEAHTCREEQVQIFGKLRFVFRLHPGKKRLGGTSRVVRTERTDEASINSRYIRYWNKWNQYTYVCTREKKTRQRVDATLIYTYHDDQRGVSLSWNNRTYVNVPCQCMHMYNYSVVCSQLPGSLIFDTTSKQLYVHVVCEKLLWIFDEVCAVLC